MGDQEERKNDQQNKKPDEEASSSQLGATGSRPTFYANEPLQFRVRGTSLVGASPPKFVSLEEIMQAAHGFQNMALAHEIAVEQDFKLEPFEPPDNSYQKIVKDTMYRAYFDILKEQLNSDPPQYKQAFILLEDVKKGLFSILLPRHTRIKQMIDEVLDTEFIKQQAVNNSLDFHKYATFVIDLMAKLAAPARDELIQSIANLTDVVEIFRAILETLEVLKLDLANTLIALIRPHVQAESVQYEQAKFDDMLKIQEDGLGNTMKWLKPHIDTTGLDLPTTDAILIRNVTAQSLAKAYLELLEWDDSNTYPETVALDAPRFLELGQQVFRVVAVASVLLVSPTCSVERSDAELFKRQLKEKLYIILEDTSSDTQLKLILPSLAEEVISRTEALLEQFNQGPLTNDVKELIRNQVISLRDPEHRVRQIVRQRVHEMLKEILVCGGGSKQVPVGLSAFSSELTSIAGTLLRYVMHNKAVFTKYYIDIVQEVLGKS